MSLRRVMLSVLPGALAACALGLAIGGCPQAQQPTVPPQDEDQPTTTPIPQPDQGIDRPIPPPPVDTGTTTVEGGTAGGSGAGGTPGTGTGGTGGGPGGAFFLVVETPGSDVRVRPGTIVNVIFQFQDSAGVVQSLELVAARDDDGNGTADGDPVYSQSAAFQPGGNTIAFDSGQLSALLTNGVGRFKLGIRSRTVAGVTKIDYSAGTVTIDAQAPTGAWVTPFTNLITNRTSVAISVTTTDNTPVTLTVQLDEDLNPGVGIMQTLIPPTVIPAGTHTTDLVGSLAAIQPGRLYNYYVTISDGVDPAFSFYAERSSGDPVKLRVTDRLIGNFDLEQLTSKTQSRGAIFQGFNFNDLAGSSVAGIPDLDGDGNDELLLASRFGKAHIIENNGVGFGEAYMIYGSEQIFAGVSALNSVGVTVPGLIFPGMRTPRNATTGNQSTRWTSGLSDVTVIPDMDGDELPELVFSFPRVESINLGETAPNIQHPELFPDLPGMGALEYTAYYGLPPLWHPNEAQFARGGIVIVSSHNEMLRNRFLLNRKSDRVIDLHEIGQLFSGMARPSLVPYIRQAQLRTDGPGPFVCADCDLQPPDGWQPGTPAMGGSPAQPGDCGDDGCDLITPGHATLVDGRETMIARWIVRWDVVFNNQGPGGFNEFWPVAPALTPPLANPAAWPYTPMTPFPFPFYPNLWIGAVPGAACAAMCEVTNEWFVWNPTLPCTTLAGTPSWATTGIAAQNPRPSCYPDNPATPMILVQPVPPCPAKEAACSNPAVTPNAGGAVAWTGFYGPTVTAFVGTATGQVFPTPMGARVLGQKVNDRFGTTVSADGTWLYISAPERTANDGPYTTDIPSLPGSRTKSGIVYQLRTFAPGPNGVNRTQLWLERGFYQVQDPNSTDPNDTITVALAWPRVDIEDVNRTDYTMPVPHQYIIESIGSLRGNPEIGKADRAFGQEGDTCPPSYNPGTDSPAASACAAYTPYPVGTAGFYIDRTPQIVGPHANARIEYVRALGDVNGDGIRDFAVGSAAIKSQIINPPASDPNVGAIFIVYGRPSGVEGDYLLEQLSLDLSNPNRLAGVLVKGANPNETLARVFADAGYFRRDPFTGLETYVDFNGDGFADVIIGNEGADGTRGEALIILGSDTLSSPGPNDAGGVPGGGWTPDSIDPTRVVRILGASPGDLVGANVSSAGDVDNDGYADVLVSSPGADGGRGAVYLIYGGQNVPGVIEIASLTPQNVDVPFVRFAGRKVNDFLGGGAKIVSGTDPSGGSTMVTSQGMAALGDINRDGLADFAVSAMLADPGGKVDAGEVYVLYGKAGP